MGNLSSHGAKAIKVSKEGRNNNSGTKKDIFFKWGDKNERTIRLVGDFRWVKTHWIGKSAFGGRDVKLFEDAAFSASNNALPNSIVCGAWDSTTESVSSDKPCVICEIMKKANQSLKENGNDFDESQKKMIQDVIFKCKATDNYFFLCIDRDEPYIAEGEKGFKIIKMPPSLLEAIINLDSKLTAADLNSDDNGIDLVIKKVAPASGKGRTEYSVTPVFEGVSIKVTPLTEEERSWNRPDLSKMAGKAFDDSYLRSCLTDDMKIILSSEDGEDAPF
jgi:hypothetical protein